MKEKRKQAGTKKEPYRKWGRKGSGLTQVEEEVLEILVVGSRLAVAGLGVQPSHRDMVSWLGYAGSGQAIEGPLGRLEKMGYIRRDNAGCQSGHGRRRAVQVLRVLDGGMVPGSGGSNS
jgi:hypothetical protein